MKETNTGRAAARIAASAALALLAAGPATSTPALAKRALVNLKQDLTSTGADPDAEGKLRVVLRTSTDSRLGVRIARLAPDARFDVLADGIRVGGIATSGGGGGRLRLRSRPRSHDGILGFDPRGAIIAVRDEAGHDVLVTTVPAAGTGGTGDIICCIPDDSGAECEDRTADECAAAGGTPTTATSCLPNPCENAPPPPGDIVCCIPDDSGPECEDRTPSECAAQGGTVVEATSCASNPCAGTAPADDEFACCVPHATPGEPLECETETPATCTALGGTLTAATSCAADPCGSGDVGGGGGDDSGDDSGGGHGGSGGSGRGGHDD